MILLAVEPAALAIVDPGGGARAFGSCGDHGQHPALWIVGVAHRISLAAVLPGAVPAKIIARGGGGGVGELHGGYAAHDIIGIRRGQGSASGIGSRAAGDEHSTGVIMSEAGGVSWWKVKANQPLLQAVRNEKLRLSHISKGSAFVPRWLPPLWNTLFRLLFFAYEFLYDYIFKE